MNSRISEYSAFVHLCFSGVLLHLNFLVNVEHHRLCGHVPEPWRIQGRGAHAEGPVQEVGGDP